ncbi:MAG: GNAT family N-acetyltransferase [Ruminococcus sp.]|nr:GNAT family N-acetyltransferase [Ruminococcus sp.]
MEIRQLLPEDDRLAVSRIYSESWRHAYKGIVPQSFLDGLSEGDWVKNLDMEGRYSLVAIADGKLIGTSSYCKSRFEKFAEYGEIISIYFLPEYMGKGYGKKLLAAAVEKLSEMGFRDVFLWVLEENHNARAFYERCGFSPSGERMTSEIGGKTLAELQYCYHIEK